METNQKNKIFLKLSILCFILGTGIQLYNYYTFKKYNWTLVKDEVNFKTPGESNFELKPNVDTEYELVLFYKKLIPENKNTELLDSNLNLNVTLTQGEYIVWEQDFKGINRTSITLQGTEALIGKFNLIKELPYTLKINTISATSFPRTDIILSVVTNQEIFKTYFYKAGVFELFFFLMFILSFVFFMIFVIFPKKSKVIE